MKVSELPYRRVTREEMTEGLQRVIERVKAAQSVEEILAARAEYLSLTTEYATAQSLSYMRYTINTVDPFYLAEKDYYDEIGPEVENLALQYASAVLDSPFREALEAALSPILLRSMELQRRSMSPEIIDDMVEENKLVSEYAQLMAGMLFPLGRAAAAADAHEIRPQRRPRHTQGMLRGPRHNAGSAQRAARRYL